MRATTTYSTAPRASYCFARTASAGAALSQGTTRPAARWAPRRGNFELPAVLLGTRIELCGELFVQLHGRRIHGSIPGRQVRLIFAYLVLNRRRPVSRDELMEVVWPVGPPADPGAALSTLLARLRVALGEGVLHGRHGLCLRLPSDAWVDVETAEVGAGRVETALGSGEPAHALEEGLATLNLIERPLLPEFDEPWVEERRRDLDDLKLSLYEAVARASLALGSNALRRAERAARTLIRLAPYRESGYLLLMEIYERRGDAAEALRVFDRLRLLLREELGTTPSRAVVDLNERLLTCGAQGSYSSRS